MRVHVLELGWLQWPKGFFRSRNLGQALRAALRGSGSGDRADVIPILSYVIEHDDGHIVIDTGVDHTLAERVNSSRVSRHVCEIRVEPSDEVGPKMRAVGLSPEDVRVVLPTHLHFDHAGGIGHFPNSEVLVHRPEWESRKKKLGYEWQYQREAWGASLQPTLYDLAADAYGPFDRSLPLTDRGDVVVLPLPGHTRGHVGIAVRTPDLTLLFTGDHVMRQSWYTADLSRGMNPINFNPWLTAKTNRSLHRFVTDFPTMILPSHDPEAARNLERWQPAQVVYGVPDRDTTIAAEPAGSEPGGRSRENWSQRPQNGRPPAAIPGEPSRAVTTQSRET